MPRFIEIHSKRIMNPSKIHALGKVSTDMATPTNHEFKTPWTYQTRLKKCDVRCFVWGQGMSWKTKRLGNPYFQCCCCHSLDSSFQETEHQLLFIIKYWFIIPFSHNEMNIRNMWVHFREFCLSPYHVPNTLVLNYLLKYPFQSVNICLNVETEIS